MEAPAGGGDESSSESTRHQHMLTSTSATPSPAATEVKGEEDPIATATKVLQGLSQPEVDANMTQGVVVAQPGVVTADVEQATAVTDSYGVRLTALNLQEDGINGNNPNSYFHTSFDDMSQSGYQQYRVQNTPSPYDRVTPPTSDAAMYSQPSPNCFQPPVHNDYMSSQLQSMRGRILTVGDGRNGGPLVSFGKMMPSRHSSLDVDIVKLEKKRERNRIAATKCRQRKLEKISTLEKEVSELKRENDNLRSERQKLSQDVARLRSELDKHMDQGCPLAAALGLDGGASAQQQQQQGGTVAYYQDQSNGLQ